jgi:Flp pilus assembly protein TadD
MKTISTLTLVFIAFFSFAQGGFKDIGKKQFKNVYAAVIGISEYNEVHDLDFAHKDAQLFYDVLITSFPEHKANFKLVQNEEAHERAIKEAIFSAQKNAKEGDLVVIYFSGHGDVMIEPGSEEGFFLAHDASNSREYFIGGAVEFDWINKMTTMATAKKAEVWLVTDACHAGKVINQESVKATMTTLNNNFEKTTKFISCQAHELSYEYSSIQHGAFTYFLAKCLSGAGNIDGDATLNVDEISSYLKKEVRVFTENKQSPKLSTSDEFSPFFNVTPELANLIKNADENGKSDLASRGKGDGDDKKSEKLTKFEKILYDGNLHGSSTSAYETLNAMKSTVSEGEYSLMKNLLIDALLARSQRNTNLFLSGRPMIGDNESMEGTSADLKLAAKLLKIDHFMYQELIDKADFFDAMVLLQKGDFKTFKKAEEVLLALNEKYPKAAFVNQGLGMLYVKNAEKNKAEEQFEKASSKIKTWDKPLNSSAYMNIVGGKLKEAKTLIEQSETLSKNGDNANLLKAMLYNAGYELQSAEAALEKIKNTDSVFTTSELLKLKGQVNELRGRYSVALTYYTKSLETDKNNIELLLKLGELYKKQRDTNTALRFYKNVVNLDNENQVALANIASLNKTSVVINNKLIDASNVGAVLDAVAILEEEKNFDLAIDLLNRSIKIINWNPDLYYELGKIQYSKGDKINSMKSIKTAIEISPYHFKSIRSLSYMYLSEKKFNEANTLIKTHDPYFPKSAKYLELSYQVYRLMDAKHDLYAILERALKLDSLETDVYRALYQLHIENNLYNEASREFENLVRIGGAGYLDSLDFYNRVEHQITSMFNRHVYSGQKEGLDILLAADPYNFQMTYYMGYALYMEGNYDEASKRLRVFGETISSFTPSVQKEYYNLRAKIALETDHPDLALRLFSMSAGQNDIPDYLGLAMAQFDLGKEWQTNFRRAKEPIDYNDDAIKRYNKMSKKMGTSGYNGGAERNRR